MTESSDTGHSTFSIFHSKFYIPFRAWRAFALHHDRGTGCARRSPTEEGEVGCSAVAALRCAASHRACLTAVRLRGLLVPRSLLAPCACLSGRQAARTSPQRAAASPPHAGSLLGNDRCKHDGYAGLSMVTGPYLGSDDAGRHTVFRRSDNEGAGFLAGGLGEVRVAH